MLATSCAALSDSKTMVEVPLPLGSLTHHPATKPGAAETRGTISSRNLAVPVSASLTLTLVTTACMALPSVVADCVRSLGTDCAPTLVHPQRRDGGLRIKWHALHK